MCLLDIPLDDLLRDDVTVDFDGLVELAPNNAPLALDSHGTSRCLALDEGVEALGDARQSHLERGFADGALVRDLVYARAVQSRGSRKVLL